MGSKSCPDSARSIAPLDLPKFQWTLLHIAKLPCGHVTGDRGRQMADSLSPTGNLRDIYKSSCFSRVFENFRSLETEETVNHLKFLFYISLSLAI